MIPIDTPRSVPRVLLIGDSARLAALQSWVVNQGLGVADGLDDDIACVIADEDALDGMCTPTQARQLAAARYRSIECLSPESCWERLAGLADGEWSPAEGPAESRPSFIDVSGTGSGAFGT